MNALFIIVFYNALIIVFILFSAWLYLMYKRKKHINSLLEKMSSSYAKFAMNNQAQMQFEKRKREWERKHPIKANNVLSDFLIEINKTFDMMKERRNSLSYE